MRAFRTVVVALLAVGFYVVYGRQSALGKSGNTTAVCDADGRCSVPRNRTRDRVVLWTATVLALAFLTFPQWSLLLVD